MVTKKHDVEDADRVSFSFRFHLGFVLYDTQVHVWLVYFLICTVLDVVLYPNSVA